MDNATPNDVESIDDETPAADAEFGATPPVEEWGPEYMEWVDDVARAAAECDDAEFRLDAEVFANYERTVR